MTGYHGTINDKGQAWWTKYKKRILAITRGPLVQLMWSKDIVITKITLCVTLHLGHFIRLIARMSLFLVSPSCLPFLELQTQMGLTQTIVHSAGIFIGSEMSGGVSNTTVENIFVWETRGVRIKTATRNINMTLENVCIGIVVKTDCNEHPDKGFDLKGC